MKRRELAIPFVILVLTACGNGNTRLMKVGNEISAGKDVAIKVDADFETYRSKQLITPPYYKECLLDSERTIVENFEETYMNGIKEALQEQGVNVVSDEDESDSLIEVELELYGNMDYGTIRVFSLLNFDGETGRIKQQDPREHRKFKPLGKMPRGLGKAGRNQFCADTWAENDVVREKVEKMMRKVSAKHVQQLKKKGVFDL